MEITLEDKPLWLKALKSGEYKQGKKALKNPNNEFCCLGVLCDVKGESVAVNWEDDGAMTPNFGFYDNIGMCIGYGLKTALVEMNDEGKSFEEIADYIEENWK